MGGHPHVHWTFDPLIILALLGYVAIYAHRFRRARAEAGGRGAGVAQAAAFALAMLVLAVATISPVSGLGEDYLFSAHMVQHVLLGDLAPLLLLLALSRVIMRPATKRFQGIERRLGPLAHPVAFLVAWLALVYVWHIPALYDLALESPIAHGAEHGTFFAAGLLFWWPLVQPVPMRRRMTGLRPFAYLVAGKAGLAALGIYLAWTDSLVYDHYLDVPRIWGLTALEDQNVGAAIMMVEQSILLVIAFAILFTGMLARSEEEERRRERLEDRAAA